MSDKEKERRRSGRIRYLVLLVVFYPFWAWLSGWLLDFLDCFKALKMCVEVQRTSPAAALTLGLLSFQVTH